MIKIRLQFDLTSSNYVKNNLWYDWMDYKTFEKKDNSQRPFFGTLKKNSQ